MTVQSHISVRNSSVRRTCGCGLWIVAVSVLGGSSTRANSDINVHPNNSNQNVAKQLAVTTPALLMKRGGGNDGNSAAEEMPPERHFIQQQRVTHVRHILNERLHYVESGQRERDISKWLKKQGDDATVVSMHGVELQQAMDDAVVSAEDHSQQNNNDEDASGGLFASNMRDLDLRPVELLPSQFPGRPQHLIDDTPPSLIRLCFRAVRLGIHFAPVLSTAWLAYLSTNFRESYWYHWMASCLASSGPAFIKWGQWASTREDMFSAALCDALAQLHNEAPSHSWSFTRKMCESSLGLPKGTLLEVFESFDTVPVASGSIAQIHKAVLRGDINNHQNVNEHGTQVAVKVRHPRVAKLIDMDFRLMSTMARIADVLPALRWLHVRDSVEQFSHTMAAQAHLNVEAHHLEVLNHNFRKWPHVKFPEPFYASSSVIVETFEPGRIVTSILDHYDAVASHLSDQQQNQHGTLTVEEVYEDDEQEEDSSDEDVVEGMGYQFLPMNLAKFIVTTGLSTYLKMLLVDNLMHADLHPGNMMIDIHANYHHHSRKPKRLSSSRALVKADPSNSHNKKLPERYRVILVDAGMVAQLTDEESVNFIGLLSSVGEGDGTLAAEFALRFSKKDDTSPMTSEQRQEFVNDMVTLFQAKCKGYGTNVNVGEVLRGVLGLVRKHHVRIDANYATLVVNALCVESLARRVCPSYNLLDASKPLLQSFRKLCLGRDGKPKQVQPATGGIRKGLVNLWLPVLYWQKTLSDNAFFRHLTKKNNINSGNKNSSKQ